MMKNIFVVFSLVSLTLMVQTAAAIDFLTDDFTVTLDVPGGDDSQNVNLDIDEGRQSGTHATSGYTWGDPHHQVGNAGTDTGQPGGASNSNTLLLAFDGWVQNDLEINAGLAGGAPLTIAFDMYVSGNPGNGDTDDWGAFTLRTAGTNPSPAVGVGQFGMLSRNSGGVQMFSDGNIFDEAAGYSTDPHWELTFTNTAGTGSAFNGSGSQVQFTNGANNGTLALSQLNSTGLLLGFSNRAAMFAGIDNLVVSGDPTAIPGDANHDGMVNAADFDAIKNNFYTSTFLSGQQGDANLDGLVNEKDFRDWRNNFVAPGSADTLASVPEPTSVVLLGLSCLLGLTTTRRGRD